MHRDRIEQWWSSAGRGEEWKGPADRTGFFSGGWELVVTAAQPLNILKPHWTIRFKMMSLMACELSQYLRKPLCSWALLLPGRPLVLRGPPSRDPQELASVLPYLRARGGDVWERFKCACCFCFIMHLKRGRGMCSQNFSCEAGHAGWGNPRCPRWQSRLCPVPWGRDTMTSFLKGSSYRAAYFPAGWWTANIKLFTAFLILSLWLVYFEEDKPLILTKFIHNMRNGSQIQNDRWWWSTKSSIT